jgi:hypothetical protein
MDNEGTYVLLKPNEFVIGLSENAAGVFEKGGEFNIKTAAQWTARQDQRL